MCWIEDLLDFWFPEPVEGGGEPASIPDSDGADPLKSVSEKQGSAPSTIPEFYKAEPAVKEAERVVRSRR